MAAVSQRSCVCRLCQSDASVNNSISLFSKSSIQKNWAARISDLLLVDMATPNGGLPSQFCSKCCRRIERLEKAASDLAEFKKQARECCRAFQLSRKRTKETSSDVGITPDTAKARPPIKMRSSISGRRLEFGPTPVADGKCACRFALTSQFTYTSRSSSIIYIIYIRSLSRSAGPGPS